MAQSTRVQRKKWRQVGGWWTNTRPEYFAPLLNFANQKFQETNWQDALWEAMGSERLGWITTSEGRMMTYVTEIDGFTEIAPHLPKISGQPAMYDLTEKLQTKVKQILNALMRIVHEVHRQRNGQGPTDWRERAKQRDLGESDYSMLPWCITHSDERQEIRDTIRREFNAPDMRRASVHSTCGFIQFDDAGEDASTTLPWMLTGLVEVVFREERPVLRRCLFCEKYFIHKSLKEKKFCSDPCRFNFHNKGLGRGTF